MGVRGHVRVSQPKYGDCALSSWVDRQAESYLRDKGVEIVKNESEDSWEIEVTDTLRDIAEGLADGRLREDFESRLDEGLRGEGYAADFGRLLSEGIEAADVNRESFITIDWF